jgi:predicted DCC family thiol-disulfide oxidoreductase YuxK
MATKPPAICLSYMVRGGIIYFDGYCNLCNSTVQLVMKNDPKGRFRFSSLGDPAVDEGPEQFDTVILEQGERRYERSSAALRVAWGMRFPWPLLGIFLLVPKFLRDPLYRLVARNRTRWFGRSRQCYLPPEGRRPIIS